MRGHTQRAATVGVAEHSSSAVVVTVAPGGELLDRRRIDLTDRGLPTHPHHHEGSWAAKHKLAAAAALAARVLCAICLPVAASQTATPAALSGTLRDHLKNERFQIVTSIRGLPLGVREGLQTLFGSQTLDIAEPGAGFQATEVSGHSKLPLRRLIAGGCSPDDHCLVYYERGGGTRTWLVVLFHWTPAATRFEWGGNARGGLATIDDVRNAVVAGAVKGPVTVW